ncbi:hypothetical protein Spico_1412 [Parasphaerochaeta coccoides DSM 17374]|uniref:Uncharacterized protein n=1 Tax=Parasphaerochaeta coccoides (strain ATCC BAA-1237 / DSM 17374 / SPN1) TaxID=760011 RepID=F4GI18_PARC1|nr:hypothetical protein Spico_1412 [Parasphaerochaeta coccoides DSM 17374]
MDFKKIRYHKMACVTHRPAPSFMTSLARSCSIPPGHFRGKPPCMSGILIELFPSKPYPPVTGVRYFFLIHILLTDFVLKISVMPEYH